MIIVIEPYDLIKSMYVYEYPLVIDFIKQQRVEI